MTRIGYARCSTDKQDLEAQRAALVDLGVAEDRIYTDHGLTGTNRERPSLSSDIRNWPGLLPHPEMLPSAVDGSRASGRTMPAIGSGVRASIP